MAIYFRGGRARSGLVAADAGSIRRALRSNGSFMIGDAATVVAKVLAADEIFGGIARITFQMSSAVMKHETMKRSIELLGTEVAPLVREAAPGKDQTPSRRQDQTP